jgi:hypothetical protein
MSYLSSEPAASQQMSATHEQNPAKAGLAEKLTDAYVVHPNPAYTSEPNIVPNIQLH